MPLGSIREHPSFSNEDIDRYWPPGAVQDSHPCTIQNSSNIGVLISGIRDFAPHLRNTFVCSEAWWEKKWGLPEVHVRPFNLFLSIFTNALADVQVPSPQGCQRHLHHLQAC